MELSVTTQLDLDSLKELLEASRFQEVYQTLAEQGYSSSVVNDPEVVPLLYPCLAHLGEPRCAEALVLRSWRQFPEHPKLLPYYLRSLVRKKGALFALQQCREYLKRVEFEEAHQQLQLFEVSILSRFRDYQRAEQKIQSLKEALGDFKYFVELADLEYQRDDLAKALNYYQLALEEKPGNRYCVQSVADILNRQGEKEEAIELLSHLTDRAQSVAVLCQLMGLAIENRQVALAYATLKRAEALVRPAQKESQRRLNPYRCDLLCLEGKYSEAIPYLDTRSGYGSKLSERLQDVADGQGKRVILNVPFEQQKHMTCAPASITSLAQYWGVTYQQEEVSQAICYDGSPALEERRWLESQGWICREFDLDESSAIELIDQGIPLLLTTVEPGSAHLQVLVGYDANMGVFLIRDPNGPRLAEMLIQESLDYYASSGPRAVVVLPQEQAPKLESVELPAAELYDLLHQFRIAEHENDRAEAYAVYRKMAALSPQHRLTINVQRTLAQQDEDAGAELKQVEALLAQYPRDVNLQLSKVNLLSSLGAVKQKVNYLESLQESEQFHFLLKSRLANELRIDARKHAQVIELVSEVFAIDPFHPDTLVTYASVLWDQGDKEQAYEIYRFLICLEDKTEYYAECYFRAARHFKEVDQALHFLKERFEAYIDKSAGPAYSLYHALASIDDYQQGLDYLEKALNKRPDDGYLIHFYIDKLLSNGEEAKCRALLETSTAQQLKLKALEAEARLQERELKTQKAIDSWHALIAYSPLHNQANHSLLAHYFGSGRAQEGLAFIDQQLLRYPGNFNLLRVKLSQLDNSHNWIEERKNTLQQLIEHHPDDAWGYEQLAETSLYLNELEEAEQSVQEALKINVSSEQAYLIYGRIAYANQDYPLARNKFRKAIELSCDCDDAYPYLIELAGTVEQVQQELSFINAQLKAQVSFGSGILEYQRTAQRWLEQEELIGCLTQLRAERPDLWQSHVALARAFAEYNELKQAEQVLQQAIAQFSLLPVLYSELATIYRKMGDLDAAEAPLQQAIEMSPSWTYPIQNLAEIYELQGRLEDAIALIQKACQRVPDAYVLKGFLADFYEKRGENEKAVQELLKALQLYPAYGWAWERVSELASASQLQNAKAILTEAREKLPADEELLRIEAGFAQTPVEKIDILRHYLDERPRSHTILHELLRSYLESEQYQQGLEFCNELQSQEHGKSTIAAHKAVFTYHLHHRTQAIEQMEALTQSDPNYYEAWRRLAHWHGAAGSKKSAQQALEECLRLYPNDVSVLSFVANHKQELGVASAEEIRELLERAVRIEPQDNYSALTLFDLYFEAKEYEAAEQVLLRLKRFRQSAFITCRELELCAVQKGEPTQLLAIWAELLTAKEANSWVADTAWKRMKKLGLLERAIALSEELIHEGHSVDPIFVVFAFRYEIELHGANAMLRYLLTASDQEPLLDRKLEGYLDYLIEKNWPIAPKLISRYRERLQQDLTNWGLVGRLHINRSQWLAAWDWYRPHLSREGIAPGVLYLASIAARSAQQWEAGCHLMERAISLPADNYREDIVVWYAFDQLLAGEFAEFAELEVINHESLIYMSQFVRHALPLLSSEQISIKSGWLKHLQADIAEIKERWKHLDDNPVIRIARHKLIETLKSRLASQGLRRHYERLRLAFMI